MQQIDRSLCWLRRDLRISDHRALHEAARSSREVIPIYVFDPDIVENLPQGALRRLVFLRDSLLALDQALEAKGKGVMIVSGDPRKLIPTIARELGAGAVFWSRDYEPWARRRDVEVSRELDRSGIRWHALKDQVVFEGSEILTGKGTPYRVFSAYERAWRKSLDSDSLRRFQVELSRLAARSAPWFRLEPLALREPRGERAMAGGERPARARLARFLERIGSYASERDFPALRATSELSPYLRFGAVSIRELFRRASSLSGDGPRKWESELIWREFFFMVLDQFPQVARGSFREEFASIRWPGADEHFAAWCEGRTGFPLVDAAMRCLVRTGWIHNRLRMVVATFLIKDLLIDWRKGEAFFAEQLIDHELASNNGGWQWCASTGVDAQPWFRIFNPVEQSRKFDPDGEFIREYCAELRGVGEEEIHFPSYPVRKAARYPEPIVDHAVQRGRALELYREAAARYKRAKGSELWSR